MTRYLSLMVTAACLLLGQAPARAATIPEIVAKTKPAIVEIVTIDQKGSPNRLGTGFFISSDGQVVTNQHVVEGAASIAAINNNGAKAEAKIFFEKDPCFFQGKKYLALRDDLKKSEANG